MASGVRRLTKIQVGKETTAGTAVAATTVWAGNGTLKDDRSITPLEFDQGIMPPSHEIYIPNAGGTLTMDAIPASYEQLPYIFTAGLMADVDGSADGSGSGKVYTYNLSTNAGATVTTMTFEMGDNNRVDEMEYGYVESFSLSGASDEAVMMSAVWKGRQVVDADFTGSMVIPTTIDHIMFNKGTFSINATAGTIGSTPKPGTLLGFTLDCTTGFIPLKSADGQLYFYAIKQNAPSITGVLTMEHNATSEAELVIARAGTTRLVQLKFPGASLTTAGTSYTYKTLIINMALQYTDVPSLGDQGGDNILAFPYRVVYSVADTPKAAQFIVVNQTTTLP